MIFIYTIIYIQLTGVDRCTRPQSIMAESLSVKLNFFATLQLCYCSETLRFNF